MGGARGGSCLDGTSRAAGTRPSLDPGPARHPASPEPVADRERLRGDLMATPAETAAMRRALALAASEGVPPGPNPRVGCVLLDRDGRTVAEGYHRGRGTAHAEVDALTNAAGRTAGTTAVVTLEPCNHTGRTGPCSRALVNARVARVVYAQVD